MTKVAIDTNVLIYLHDVNNTLFKKDLAAELLGLEPVIPPQVISEYLNVCHNRLKFSKEVALESLFDWLPYCRLCGVDATTFLEARRLIKKYNFQMFDAVIVASALLAGCSTLVSEDMHHHLNVDGKLLIVNPFKSV